MEQKPLILITMGDPAGIGPEIIAKALDGGRLFDLCRPVVVGDAGVMNKLIEDMRFSISVRSITAVGQADPAPGKLDVLSLNLVNMNMHAWGRPDVSSGMAVVAYVKRAVEATLAHEADAIVTAPINKAMMNAAGYHYAGHTELLAALTQSEEFGMLFVGGGLRVILATIHLPLREVASHISPAGILRSLRLAKKAMASFGMENPRIGVAALNPHAGEGRLFGNEEWDQIMPAVIEARGEGIDASDPVPADTLFYKARNNYYDVVLAMYHDQGLAPLKMLAFGNAVNVTVGLPIIRTSVDHGTAYDIAGKGCADPASLIEAVNLAAKMSLLKRHRLREGA
jgi:4-phospho-D-threonate 3-dehydrogenase / 4-phospho-D-erythronate 3-dehydrogenase